MFALKLATDSYLDISLKTHKYQPHRDAGGKNRGSPKSIHAKVVEIFDLTDTDHVQLVT